MRAIAAVLAAASSVLLAAATASADTLRVPTEAYPTIQSAIDAAGDGDRIVVGNKLVSFADLTPGGDPDKFAAVYYEESLVIAGKSNLTIVGVGRFVTLKSPADGPPDAEPRIRVEGGQNITLRGLELVEAFGAPCLVAMGVTNLRIVDVSFGQWPPTAGLGIHTRDCSGVLVSRCRFEGVAQGVLDESSHAVTIEKCRFRGDDDPIRLSPGAAPGEGSDGAVIRGNRFYAGRHYTGPGIIVVGNGAVIDRNDVRRDDGSAIHVIGDGAVITRNLLVNAHASGVLVEGDGAVLASNRVRTALGHGVEVAGSGAVLRGNRVEGWFDALHLTGSAFTVERNQVGAVGNGVYVDAPGSIVRGNRLLRPTNNSPVVQGVGIYIVSDQVTVTRNVMTKCATLDLADANAPGVNVYERNVFWTMDFNYVP